MKTDYDKLLSRAQKVQPGKATDANRAELIPIVRELRAKGLTWAAIAEWMTKEARITRTRSNWWRFHKTHCGEVAK